MKMWTYSEASTKVMTDLDLLDETFISSDELVGYFNEGITEAKSEIQAMNQDYFLTKYYVPLVTGTKVYNLPKNILANKIRGIVYVNGEIRYEVCQFRRSGKFIDLEDTDYYSNSTQYYGYILLNDYPGQAQLELHPAARETAILPPSASAFTPMKMFYIRDCARIPILGEYCNPEVINPTSVSAVANTIQTLAGSTTSMGITAQGVAGAYPGSIAYITGDAVKLKAGPGGTLPSPLVENTVYYVIQTGSGLIKLATTRANALLGTAIDLTTAGTVFFEIYVAATAAIIDATIIDIPEFITFVMQWVRCRCMSKEGDPRFEAESAILLAQKKQMIDTLTESIQDDDNQIMGDFSAYEEMS